MRAGKRQVKKNGHGRHGRGPKKKQRKSRKVVRRRGGKKSRRLRERLTLDKGLLGLGRGPKKRPRMEDSPVNLDSLNDDELARELGLGEDANDAVENANRVIGGPNLDDNLGDGNSLLAK
jgi:hypothetical protein